jgi:hypothetical protein
VTDQVTPGEEAQRRAMISEGLDPTDQAQREWYADTVAGTLLRISTELDVLGRKLWQRT